MDNDSHKMMLRLSPKAIGRVLYLVVAFLVVANLAVTTLRHFVGTDSYYELVRLFDLDEEANLPTWFSTAMLLSCALLLALIASAKRQRGGPYVFHWLFLAGTFTLLSADEAASLHELLSESADYYFGTEYLFYNIWLIGVIVALALLALVYRKFFFSLPRGVRYRLLLASMIYLGGAFVLDAKSWMSGPNWVFVNVEEILELTGVTMFLNALVLQLCDLGAVTIESGR